MIPNRSVDFSQFYHLFIFLADETSTINFDRDQIFVLVKEIVHAYPFLDYPDELEDLLRRETGSNSWGSCTSDDFLFDLVDHVPMIVYSDGSGRTRPCPHLNDDINNNLNDTGVDSARGTVYEGSSGNNNNASFCTNAPNIEESLVFVSCASYFEPFSSFPSPLRSIFDAER